MTITNTGKVKTKGFNVMSLKDDLSNQSITELEETQKIITDLINEKKDEQRKILQAEYEKMQNEFADKASELGIKLSGITAPKKKANKVSKYRNPENHAQVASSKGAKWVKELLASGKTEAELLIENQ